LPYRRRIFTDAAGKNERIGSTQHCQIGADILFDAMAENIDRQLGAAILMLALFVQQIAHIVGQTGNAEQTGLLVEQRIDFAERHPLFVRKIFQHRRIDIPAAGSHHQAFQRRHAHGSIQRVAVLDGAGRAAVAKVQRDDVGFLARFAGELTVAIRHVTMRSAIKTVAPDFVPAIKLVRNGVKIRSFRHRRCKHGGGGRHLLRPAGSNRTDAQIDGGVCARRGV